MKLIRFLTDDPIRMMFCMILVAAVGSISLGLLVLTDAHVFAWVSVIAVTALGFLLGFGWGRGARP